MEPTILIVEDDRQFAYLLREDLQDRGFQVLLADDGVDGVHLVEKHDPDLVVLDVMMPRMDGWEACRRIRKVSAVPIIILTARRDELDRIRGLELGADDYVVKPCSGAELAARIQAVLRRCRGTISPEQIVQIDDRLTVDWTRHQILIDGQPVDLSDIEYRLLTCLLKKPNQIWTPQSLLTEVWGWEYADETGYLKVYVHRLRQKIEPDPRHPRYILSERGRGYWFQVPS